jgi:hypothetical protein
MAARPDAAVHVPVAPGVERQPEPVSAQLQRVFDALSAAHQPRSTRSRIRESSAGFWTIKPTR